MNKKTAIEINLKTKKKIKNKTTKIKKKIHAEQFLFFFLLAIKLFSQTTKKPGNSIHSMYNSFRLLLFFFSLPMNNDDQNDNDDDENTITNDHSDDDYLLFILQWESVKCAKINKKNKIFKVVKN